MTAALKKHRYLAWLRALHAKIRTKTFTVNFLGSRFIHTIEPENMKSLSTQVWKDFGVEPLRPLDKASMPFADKGVNTTDGHMWEFSRFSIKPYFVRDAFSNTDRLEKHTDNLMALIPLDAVALVHKFVDKHIDKAYEEMHKLPKSKVVDTQDSSTEAEKERSDLL